MQGILLDPLLDPAKCHAFSLTLTPSNSAPLQDVLDTGSYPIVYGAIVTLINVTIYSESEPKLFQARFDGVYLFTVSFLTLAFPDEDDDDVWLDIVKVTTTGPVVLATAWKGQQLYGPSEVPDRKGGSVSVVAEMLTNEGVFTQIRTDNNRPFRLAQVDFTGVYIGQK
jgi:hypothetical protein